MELWDVVYFTCPEE